MKNDSRIPTTGNADKKRPGSTRPLAERSGKGLERAVAHTPKMGAGREHATRRNTGSPVADPLPGAPKTKAVTPSSAVVDIYCRMAAVRGVTDDKIVAARIAAKPPFKPGDRVRLSDWDAKSYQYRGLAGKVHCVTDTLHNGLCWRVGIAGGKHYYSSSIFELVSRPGGGVTA